LLSTSSCLPPAMAAAASDSPRHILRPGLRMDLALLHLSAASQRQSGIQEQFGGRSGSRPASQSSVTQPQHHQTESGERLKHMQQQAAGHCKVCNCFSNPCNKV
jgi:hypothetical protein